MKAEKVYPDKTIRIIQKKNNGSNQVQFIDNHPSAGVHSLQKKTLGDISCATKQTTVKIIQKRKKKRTAFEGILKDNDRKKEFHVLVYGTENARKQQREKTNVDLPQGFSLTKDKHPNGYATTGFYTVDIYNNYSWRDFPKGMVVTVNENEIDPYFSIFNPLYLKKKPSDDDIKKDLELFTETNLSTLEGKKAEVLEYQKNLLDHPNYSPIKTLRENAEFVKKKEPVEGKDNVKNGNDITEEEKTVAKSRFELQTRRACKFGLEYMSKKLIDRKEMGEVAFLTSVYGGSPNKEKEPTDSSDILNKTKTRNRASGKPSHERVPITTSEMRKLFRIRSGNIGIRFYNSAGELVKAPWNKSGKYCAIHK